MLPGSASTPARPVSTAARCRLRSGPAAPGPIASTGMCCRSTPIPRKAPSPSRSASKHPGQPMDWLGAEAALIATRAIHFAATAIAAGTLLFRTVIAGPVLRTEAAVAEAFRTQSLRLVWISLLVAAISGAIWLLLQAASMSGLPFGDMGVLPTIIDETQFGNVAEVRFATAILLAICLALDRFRGANWLALVA